MIDRGLSSSDGEGLFACLAENTRRTQLLSILVKRSEEIGQAGDQAE